MITHFDIIVSILILIVMWKTTMPKQVVIGLVGLCAASVTLYDHFLDGWTPYYLGSITETIAAIAIIRYSRDLRHDKPFFHLMAFLLLMSSFLSMLFKYDVIVAHSDYVAASQSLAMVHVALMIIYSDGLRGLIGSISDGASRIWHSRNDIVGNER